MLFPTTPAAALVNSASGSVSAPPVLSPAASSSDGGDRAWSSNGAWSSSGAWSGCWSRQANRRCLGGDLKRLAAHFTALDIWTNSAPAISASGGSASARPVAAVAARIAKTQAWLSKLSKLSRLSKLSSRQRNRSRSVRPEGVPSIADCEAREPRDHTHTYAIQEVPHHHSKCLSQNQPRTLLC